MLKPVVCTQYSRSSTMLGIQRKKKDLKKMPRKKLEYKKQDMK